MFLNNNNESLRLYKGHALSLLETAPKAQPGRLHRQGNNKIALGLKGQVIALLGNMSHEPLLKQAP